MNYLRIQQLLLLLMELQGVRSDVERSWKELQRVYVQDGRDVLLEVRVTHDTRPRIVWSHAGQILHSSLGDNTYLESLVFTARKSTGPIYEIFCSAYGKNGNSSVLFIVCVDDFNPIYCPFLVTVLAFLVLGLLFYVPFTYCVRLCRIMNGEVGIFLQKDILVIIGVGLTLTAWIGVIVVNLAIKRHIIKVCFENTYVASFLFVIIGPVAMAIGVGAILLRKGIIDCGDEIKVVPHREVEEKVERVEQIEKVEEGEKVEQVEQAEKEEKEGK